VLIVQAPAGTYLDRLELAAGPTTTAMRFTSLVAFGLSYGSTTQLNFGMIATDGDGDAVSGSLKITVTNTACGDGTRVPGEQCDPFPPNVPPVNGDGCSVTCQSEAPFEIEPNGSTATATPLWPAWPAFEWRGSITPIGDHDYFTFTLPAPGSVTLVTHDPSSPGTCAFNTRIHLLDGSGVELTQDDDSGPASCSQIGSGLLPAGTYFVWVQHFNDTQTITQYQLDLTFM
jgi:cysteine-rich repeat protein